MSARTPEKTAPHSDAAHAAHGTPRTMAIGFVLSLLLTLGAYALVARGTATGWIVVATLIACAGLQLFVQLIFFLNLDREAKPRWHGMAFAFAAMVVAIIVLGSLWIMYNLDYHMMPAHEMEHELLEEEGIKH